jgi:ABC-type glycerol-3-phosphate transport system substrate-binding protein
MTRGLSRRAFLTGSLGVGALGVLVACQQAPPATPQVVTKEVIVEKPVERVVTQVVERQVTQVVERQVTVVAAAPAKAKPKGKLVFWGHDNHPIDNAVPGFKERYPDTEFDAQHIGEWLTKFKASLASGNEVPDLVWLEATDIQNFGQQGVLLDVSDIVAPNKEKFVKAKLGEVFIVKRGQYAAIPSDLALVGLWYRQDVLEKAGVKEFPKDITFDDFTKLATQVNKSSGTAAFLLPKNGWAWPFEIILAQLGGSVTTADGGKVTIDDEKGIAAMTFLKQLWDTKAALDTDWLQPPYWGALKAGKLASDYMPAWMRGFVRDETKSPDQGLGQWRVTLLPTMPGGEGRSSQIGGACLSSTKFTKNPEAVKAFMEFAFGTIDGTIATGSWGIIPGYLPYLESSIFQNQKDPVFGDFLFGKVWTQAAKELSTNYFRMPVFGEAETIVRQNMMPILRGEVPVKDGMKSIGDKVRQANDRYQ